MKRILILILIITITTSCDDTEYYELLVKAVKKKLNILCYDCKFSTKGIKLNREIQFKK